MKRMRNVFFKTGICLLALVVMVGIALPCRAADLSTVETVLAQTITRYLCDWTVKGYSSAYKDISAAADIWSLSTEDSAVTAEALVTVTMTLKDKSVSTMPAIQGMLSTLG